MRRVRAARPTREQHRSWLLEPFGIVDGVIGQWRDELEVNLMGLMVATHAAARRMLEQGAGHIVNVSSLAGRYPAGQVPGYVTSKFGVNGFTESARRDLRRHGVRVTLVEPGEVATPMQPQEDLATTRMLDPKDVADAILYAVTRPDHVCINDIQIVFNPTGRKAGMCPIARVVRYERNLSSDAPGRHCQPQRARHVSRSVNT